MKQPTPLTNNFTATLSHGSAIEPPPVIDASLATLLAALIGVLASVIGGTVTHYLTTRREVKKEIELEIKKAVQLQLCLFNQYNKICLIYKHMFESKRNDPNRHITIAPSHIKEKLHSFEFNDYIFLINEEDAMLYPEITLIQDRAEKIIDAVFERSKIHIEIQSLVNEDSPIPPQDLETQCKNYTDSIISQIDVFMRDTPGVLERLEKYLKKKYRKGKFMSIKMND